MTPATTQFGSSAAILEIGASSPIGYGTRPIQLAIAAGLRNFQDATPTGDDGQPVRASRLPELGDAVPRAERIATLTRWAAADLLKQITVYLPTRIPVFVGLATDAPVSDLEAVRQGLADGSDGLLDSKAVALHVIRAGRIAFLSALPTAIRSFDQGAGELALVVATDTRCTPEIIDGLIRERRILTTQSDGTIPSEGAVVALIASARSATASQHARVYVSTPSFADDSFEILRRSPQVTQGLGRAFRTLREDPVCGALRPFTVIAFESGELFFTRAFTTGYLRNTEIMPEPLQHELIASAVGDTGAAAAGFALVRADWALDRRHVEGEHRVLIYGHADDGKCAAAIAIRRK
jgi:hypothetical protein